MNFLTFRLNQARRRAKPFHGGNPNFLFSTWPIPHWTGNRAEMLVTGEDSTVTGADFQYNGPEDHPRLQQILNRLSACGGSVMIFEGTFRLSETLDLGQCRDSIVMDCTFIGVP